MLYYNFLPTTFATYLNEIFYLLQRFGIFFLFEKENACKRKAKLCPQEGKQAPLKSKSFCAMLRKNRLKCESISARLFLACHQKSNAFKCKQFCCAKPTLAHLLAGGFPLYPRERRAAVHGLCFSVGSSAHSPVNSLRSNSTGNVAEAPPVADKARRCWRKTRSIAPAPRAIGDYVLRGLCGGLQSKPFPRSSQLGCTTAARLLEACSSRFIKSLALPFLLFFSTTSASPCRIHKNPTQGIFLG